MWKSLLLTAAIMGLAAAPAVAESAKPTVILVHGAFAEGSSWDAVATRLRADGYPTLIAANNLRGIEADTATVAALAKGVPGPVVLVGHSYGGVLISGPMSENVKALVYVAGFAPDAGESALTLSSKFPGSALGDAIAPAPLPGGDADLYIRADRFHAVFAADVDAARGEVMAASQRPATGASLSTAFDGSPAWKTLPSWFIYGDADLCIPAALHSFMAERAGSRRTVMVAGGSHALMVSQPQAVAEFIETAAQAEGAP